MTFNPEDFGRRIRDQRIKHNLTQAELADAIGMSLSHISKLELGQVKPSVDAVFLFANYFHTSREYFLSGCEWKDNKVQTIVRQVMKLLAQLLFED